MSENFRAWDKLKIYMFPLPERIVILWAFLYSITSSVVVILLGGIEDIGVWEMVGLIGFIMLAAWVISGDYSNYICLNNKENKLIIREGIFKKREFPLENLSDIKLVDTEGGKAFIIEFFFDNAPKHTVRSWGGSNVRELIINKHERQRKRLNTFIEKWTYLYVYDK